MATSSLSELRAPRESNMPVVQAGFFDLQSFELSQRVAKAFMASDLVPKQYQGNLSNCMIALDMAQRIGANPLMVMQNLYVVHGTPGWSSKFLIATVNTCGRYSTLRYEWRGNPGDDDYGCRAWAIERSTNERLNGIWVDWKMVKAEGWSSKNGSKWKTMADQMFIYRAAAFWQRAYAPELGMGLSTAEELYDTIDATTGPDGTIQVDVDSLRASRRTEAPEDKPAAENKSRRSRKPAEPVQDVDPETGEVMNAAPAIANDPAPELPPQDVQPAAEPEPARQAAPQAQAAATQADAPTYQQVADMLRKAQTMDALAVAADLIREVEHPDEQGDLFMIYDEELARLEKIRATYQPAPTGGRPARNRGLDLE